jgi:hypothetical protein
LRQWRDARAGSSQGLGCPTPHVIGRGAVADAGRFGEEGGETTRSFALSRARTDFSFFFLNNKGLLVIKGSVHEVCCDFVSVLLLAVFPLDARHFSPDGADAPAAAGGCHAEYRFHLSCRGLLHAPFGW